MSIKKAIAARVISLCEERNITPRELASRSDVTLTTLRKLLDGRDGDVSLDTVHRLCCGFNLPLDEFFDSKEFSFPEDVLDGRDS